MGCTSLLKHVDQLYKLCRICSICISKKSGYADSKNVTKFAATIYKAYNIDVVIENPSIFPKYLCSSCRRKLQTLSSKPIDVSHILLQSLQNIMIAVLFASVHHIKCRDSTKVVWLSLTEIGFVTYRESSLYRRIYVRQKLKK